jgi:hypothetical protein
MKIAVKTIEGGSAGEIDLADAVFAVPVRKDILHRCVVWQLSRRQQGTHKTKGRAEVTATAKKMYAQKGTGRARHGNEAAPQFRVGGDLEGHLAVLGAVGRLLGDERCTDHFVHARPRDGHGLVAFRAHCRRSSRCFTASRVSTSVSRRRMS